jgi:hypothetical protein
LSNLSQRQQFRAFAKCDEGFPTQLSTVAVDCHEYIGSDAARREFGIAVMAWEIPGRRSFER